MIDPHPQGLRPNLAHPTTDEPGSRPHQGSGNDSRGRPGQGDDGHDPPETDQRSGQSRDFGTSRHSAPAPGLAVGDRLDKSVHRRECPTPASGG